MFIHPEHLCDHASQRYQQILAEASVCRESQKRLIIQIAGMLIRLNHRLALRGFVVSVALCKTRTSQTP
jgi:hypothetical protein